MALYMPHGLHHLRQPFGVLASTRNVRSIFPLYRALGQSYPSLHEEIFMINLKNRAACLLLTSGTMLTMTANAARDADSETEARKTTSETTPQAQYQMLSKEANAAYREAVADCKKMRGADRTACTKEARANLRSDLIEAKKTLSTGQ